MSYTEKIDVLDLIINVVKEHEEKLDQLVERLEVICDRCPLLKDAKREDWL